MVGGYGSYTECQRRSKLSVCLTVQSLMDAKFVCIMCDMMYWQTELTCYVNGSFIKYFITLV